MENEIRSLRVKIRGMDKLVRIQEEVYPFMEMGLAYIRMVRTNDVGPTEFIIVRPDDIEYRVQKYTEEFMQEIRDASDAAIEQQNEYMLKRAAEAVNEQPTAPSEHDFV